MGGVKFVEKILYFVVGKFEMRGKCRAVPLGVVCASNPLFLHDVRERGQMQ